MVKKSKTVEAKGDWECLDPDCKVLIRRDPKTHLLETKIACPISKLEHAQTFQRDFADPSMRKRITVEEKDGS